HPKVQAAATRSIEPTFPRPTTRFAIPEGLLQEAPSPRDVPLEPIRAPEATFTWRSPRALSPPPSATPKAAPPPAALRDHQPKKIVTRPSPGRRCALQALPPRLRRG